MRKQFGRLLVGTAIVVAATLLAGCASSTPSSGPTGGSLTFVTWTGGDAGIKYTNLIKKFEAKNPGWKVDLQILAGDNTYNGIVTSQIQANKAPDILEVMASNLNDFESGGLLTNLSDQSWVQNQVPVIKSIATDAGGKTYTFTDGMVGLGVFYNKDLFTQEGVSVPTTWNEMLSDIDKFHAAGITPLASGVKDVWPLGVQTAIMAADQLSSRKSERDDLMSAKLSYTDSKSWLKTETDIADLVARKAYDPNVLGIDWPTSANDFAAGKAAMMIQGTYALPAIRAANKSMNLGFFPLPYGSGSTPPTIVGYGSHLGIPSNAKNKEEAKKFLDFLATSSVYKKYLEDAAEFPALKNTDPTLDPSLVDFAKLAQGKAFEGSIWSGANLPTVNAAFGSLTQGLFNGTTTPQKILAGMQAAR